jgi:hypothetical protein
MIRMAIQVVFIDDANDQRDVHEIVGIDRGQLCPAVLGLSLAEAKKITGGIQQVLTGVQVAEWQADQRACPDCGNRRPLKGHHRIVFRTPFGKLRLDSERVRVCPCAQSPTISVSPLADLLSERVSPEMLFLETKFASLVSYGLTVRLLDELLPFDRPIGTERVRRHLFRVAEAHEAELASAPTSITVDERTGPNSELPDGSLFVGMDGGYVRGREQAWFEAIAGKSLISFHRDGRVPDPAGRCFAFVQTVDDKPRARLVDTLRQQGMQPQQQVIFMSDGCRHSPSSAAEHRPGSRARIGLVPCHHAADRAGSDDQGGLGRRGHGRDQGSRSGADQMAALARQCPGCDRRHRMSSR